MQRWRGIDATPTGWGRCVVTIGMYDGVHRGHQRLIGRAVQRAGQLGLPCLVVTFDPHPSEVVRPGSHPPILTAPAVKADLIGGLGADALCVLPFTPEFSRVPADEFVHTVLVQRLHVAEVVVGENFTFGHKAAGTVDTLTTLGERFGFAVDPVSLLAGDGVAISSTYVRACVAAGDVEAAERALGRAHRVDGIVVRGDHRGRDQAHGRRHAHPCGLREPVHRGRSGAYPAASRRR